jgi:phosphatidylglycerophosphatase A
MKRDERVNVEECSLRRGHGQVVWDEGVGHARLDVPKKLEAILILILLLLYFSLSTSSLIQTLFFPFCFFLFRAFTLTFRLCTYS